MGHSCESYVLLQTVLCRLSSSRSLYCSLARRPCTQRKASLSTRYMALRTYSTVGTPCIVAAPRPGQTDNSTRPRSNTLRRCADDSDDTPTRRSARVDSSDRMSDAVRCGASTCTSRGDSGPGRSSRSPSGSDGTQWGVRYYSSTKPKVLVKAVLI
jgi:hypothetical protein